jgi:4-hydroxybenzoate polyprenyltransferase
MTTRAGMPRSLVPYLQLVRLPNVLTAPADSLAGWLLVGGSLADVRYWLPLATASMFLYAGGIALNDLVDLETDRVERPRRPLPSGRVSRAFAGTLVTACFILGPFLALLSGSLWSLFVATLLSIAIRAYNSGLKRTALGPQIMGACRGLNLLLGMTHSPALGGPAGWLAALSFGVFVAGITWISRSETKSGETRNLLLGLTIQNLALLGLMALALQPRLFPNPPSDRPVIPLEGLLVLALVALAINLAASRAIHEPEPEMIQRAVKAGIFSLVWIDVGVVAAVRGPQVAVAVAVLWLPAYLLGRWLYST